MGEDLAGRLFFPRFDYNEHLERLVQIFGPPKPGETILPDNVTYIFLCYTNRCGSNYLAEMLASSGAYNLAGEFLNWDTVEAHRRHRGFTSISQYFQWLTAELSINGSLLMKIAATHIELLCAAGILDRIIARSRFIMMERNDKLSQAISHAIAFGTGRYTSLMAGDKEPSDVSFSCQLIDHILLGIADAQRAFDLFFARNGIVPVSLAYEQFIADPDLHLQSVLRQLGQAPLHIRHDRLQLKRQANEINRLWRARYLAERVP